MPKPFVLSKPFVLLMLLLAGVTGAAYGLHQTAGTTASALDSDDTDSSPLPDTHRPLAVHHVPNYAPPPQP